MTASRIAIVGSCVTRDLFPADAGLLYLARTSLPSLLSAPVAGFVPPAETDPMGGLEPWARRMVLYEATKAGLSVLLDYAPQTIVFDFIDERTQLLEIGAALVSDSVEFRQSGLHLTPPFARARIIARASRECDELWTAAVRRLARILGHRLPDARIVLHRAGWCAHALGEDGLLRPFDPATQIERQVNNPLLGRYHRLFLQSFPQAHAINASPAHRIADAGHRWGPKPYHYVPGYYPAVLAELKAAILRDPALGPYRSPTAPRIGASAAA